MNSRSYHILESRPEIPSAKVNDRMSDDEQFQNRTLRPIIKLQNNLFVEVFRNYICKRKYSFYDLTLERRYAYI
ncbi:MAG: glyoxalase, partial [Flavobacteriaceae bacterium]|nr:glyoxalase [Flavobacteriaceae bacterium]